MAKEEALKVNGQVIEVLPNAMFRVQIENTESVVIAYAGGKLQKNNIKILLGDSVEMDMSPYDLTKARITYRNK